MKKEYFVRTQCLNNDRYFLILKLKSESDEIFFILERCVKRNWNFLSKEIWLVITQHKILLVLTLKTYLKILLLLF